MGVDPSGAKSALRGGDALAHRYPATAATGVRHGADRALVPSVAGIWLDPRAIAKAPAWLKPSKFAVSTAIYG